LTNAKRKGSAKGLWAVRANRQARPEDLFVLLTQDNPRGLIGFGRLLTGSSLQSDPEMHQVERKRARVCFERLIDPKSEPLIVSESELKTALPTWPPLIRASGQIRVGPADEHWLVDKLY
jgi:hypothetical protein